MPVHPRRTRAVIALTLAMLFGQAQATVADAAMPIHLTAASAMPIHLTDWMAKAAPILTNDNA